MFNVKMLPADYGDCLWITYGTDARQHQILIDGGTKESAIRLKRRITSLNKRQRHFELFVITHIDSDHIGGALSLLRDMEALGVTFGDVWFNGWKHIAPLNLTPREGELLSANIVERKLNWNSSFGGATVMVSDKGELPVCQLPGGMKLTVLSPTLVQLDRLMKHWYKVITDAGLVPGQAKGEPVPGGLVLSDDDSQPINVETLSDTVFKGDNAVANGSSIALLAEYEGRRCLLAADAFAPLLAASIKRLLKFESRAKLKLDAFKLSHHGSRANTSKALLDLIECPRYLFSSNGKQFGHPHRESVARVIKFGGASPSLYFNYRTVINGVWDDEELIERFDYHPVYCDAQGALVVEL
jgi:hypothetical protein